MCVCCIYTSYMYYSICTHKHSITYVCVYIYIHIHYVSHIYIYIYSIIWMCVCVHGGLHCRRKAGASKWTKSGSSGPSSSSCLLFRGPKNGAKNRPQKRGRNIAGRRQGFRPRFWDQGVAYTVSPPLRAVSSGDSGSSKFHIEGPPSRMHFSYADAAPKAGSGGSAV